MVRVNEIDLDPVSKNAIVKLFADSKNDITANMNPEGMMSGYKIAMGSSVLTASGDFAFMKSDGTWNWL